MNVVMMSPHFPLNFINFSYQLKQVGATVLGIADAPYEMLDARLRESLTEYYRVSDMHNYDELVKAMGYFTYKYGKIDRLESHNEYWLESDARLRTDFNIFGVKTDWLDNIKCKSLMKKLYVEAGVPVARGKVVYSRDEAYGFLAEVGYPVVVKPDNGVGAAKTYKLKSDSDFEEFWAEKPEEVDYIMEEFIEGDIVSFDGVTDRHGNIAFVASNEFSQGVMDTVNKDLDIYYITQRHISPELEDAGLRTLKVFNVRERFFHLEFFRNRKDGRIISLEVNMRPPGGLTMDMFNWACDIDLYREWANLVEFDRMDNPNYERKYYVAYIGRKNGKNYIHSHEEIMQRYGWAIVQNEPISGVFRNALGDYAYLARSASYDELMEIVNFAQAKY